MMGIMNINLAVKFIFSFYRGKNARCVCVVKKKRRVCDRRGVTLVELMTVMAILAVSVGMFYTVWFSNWRTFDHHTAVADLWSDANEIAEQMSMDGRAASQITVAVGQKSVDFVNALGNTYATYQITAAGDFTITRGAAVTTVTDRIDFANSNFIQQGSALQTDLILVDEEVLGDDVSINAQMEVFPRN